MSIRNFILFAGLSVFLFGCVAPPGPPSAIRADSDYYDYRDTPSYQGYYYVRIIFIAGIPYYVGDDLQARPIPRHLRRHFIRYPYQRLHRPPEFSRDREEREGYPMSRIIYLNGVPYHVGDNRKAQPLPNNVRQRFRYSPAIQEREERRDESPEFGPARRDNEDNARERDQQNRRIFQRRQQDDAIQRAPDRSNTDSRRMPQTRERRSIQQDNRRRLRIEDQGDDDRSRIRGRGNDRRD